VAHKTQHTPLEHSRGVVARGSGLGDFLHHRGIGGASQDNYTPDPQCQLTKELTRRLYRMSNVQSQPLHSDTPYRVEPRGIGH